jgi:hypothetical protein
LAEDLLARGTRVDLWRRRLENPSIVKVKQVGNGEISWI